jgi:hypothetical protein
VSRSRFRVIVAIGAAVALLAAASSGAQAKSFGGVVPDVPTGTHVLRSSTARIANVSYDGGPVMHSNRTHLIFWQPSESGLGYDPGYEALIETFLARVAADSHRPTNVYGLSGQYTDLYGPAANDSTYAGAVLATDRLPVSDCSEPLAAGPGWSECLSDSQLEAEIEHVIAADHLPRTPRDVYFLVTPDGLGSCEASGPDDCALGGDAAGSYCGYHSSTPDGTILYAVIPYNAVSGHCQSGNPRPNSSTADPTISTISHEHNEAVTDPLGNGWIDGPGNEIGDLCISQFGRDLGGSGSAAWNEVIHGGRYYLQEEWSNDDSSCRPRDESDSISFSMTGRASAGNSLSFAGHARDPDGSIVAYNWFFGDGRSGHRRLLSHAYRRAGSYRVVLRSTDRADNWAFYVRTIRVTKSSAPEAAKSGWAMFR